MALKSLYRTAVEHPNRALRIVAMGTVFHLCLLRCLVLFARELLVLGTLLILLISSSALQGVQAVQLVLLSMLVVQLWCCVQASLRVEHIEGHRAGAKGYTGVFVENTIEAMQDLVARDNGPEGPLPDVYYIEIDIQETADGELVVLHDFHLADAFPDQGPNQEPYRQLRQQLGLEDTQTFRQIGVKDVTTSQLQSLHLGARRGLAAPTLAAFMAAFRAAACRRPLVVEVKRLQTDKGRRRLLQLLREHLPYAQQQQQLYPANAAPRLGFLALISFPHYYAASLGEFGSRQWATWGSQLAALGVPVRCCFLEQLSYVRGLSPRGAARR